jgi:catechol 2,3-dioxygenase-like lactoylglutathione lyase family enzyme
MMNPLRGRELTAINGRPKLAPAMNDFDARKHDWSPLVPELNVQDIGRSLHFWCELVGFRTLFDRADAGFAYLEREGAEVMLEQLNHASWSVGDLARPFGRGINLQIATSAIEPILNRLAAAGWPLFVQPAERWYKTGRVESGQRQFLVQDPDGYLLRFAEGLGERALAL